MLAFITTLRTRRIPRIIAVSNHCFKTPLRRSHSSRAMTTA